MFILFPNQLYENFNLIGEDVYLVEESLYFYDKLRDFKINKIKLAYIVACMHYYYDWLKSKKINANYIKYNELDEFYDLVKKQKKVSIFDPTDELVLSRYKKLNSQIEIHDSPNFIMTLKELDIYHSSHPNTTQQQHFFKFVKNKIGILENTKSFDKYNRNPFPKNFVEVPNYSIPDFNTKITKKYYQEGIKFVSDYFSDNIGDTKEVYRYPITHKQAHNAFINFLQNRFDNFGKYEDAISTNEKDPVLFHSCISAALNIGLLCPKKIVKIVMQCPEIQNVESYVRQIAGWREYMRFQYTHYWPKFKFANVLDNNKKITNWNIWHKGETGIMPLDCEIKKAVKFGYAHHIVRLMIFLNIFILEEIDPRDIYRWFMEVVSIDAWEWVMISNIYMMGCFVGTKAMRRPYISSSNYIIKMSQYKRGDWCDIWDQKYHKFVLKKVNKPGMGFYRK